MRADIDFKAVLKARGMDKKNIDVERVIRLLRDGDRIEAVKIVLHQSKMGLKASKDLCDDIMGRLS